VRLSRVIDPCGAHRIGKTVIGIFAARTAGG
jgi:hypothetical protein